EVKNAKIALLTVAFEPPKLKTKYSLEIDSPEKYKELYAAEQEYFIEQVEMVKKSGANVVFCQWGFDDEANHLLMKAGIPAVRWVSATDLEAIAIATGGSIVGRFEDLSPEKLGSCGVIREVSTGTMADRHIEVLDCPHSQ
ncbi:chaperonin Cpn60/TCP-1 family, partial [Kipferlia bialata]